jgi:hypothetical protein
MSEGPTATPEPVPWGDKADPFPEGTVLEFPDGERGIVGPCDHPRMITVDGRPLLPEEIQGRIDEAGWEVVDREGAS